MLSRGPMRGQLFRKAKAKSMRMTTLIVIAFIICWTPYYVVFVTFTFASDTQHLEKASMWIFFFGMANSMVNPLIYGAFQVWGKRRSVSGIFALLMDDSWIFPHYQFCLNLTLFDYLFTSPV